MSVGVLQETEWFGDGVYKMDGSAVDCWLSGTSGRSTEVRA